MFYKHDEFFLLKCKEEFKHRGPIYVMTSEIVEGVSVLFSGGVDGTIKYWNTEMETQKESNYITTIFAHKGTVLALCYCKSRNILISSSTDMTIKVWKLKENFDKILNPLFQCIATFKDFEVKKRKEDDQPFWINTLSLKETEYTELYAGDTKGRVLFYHFVDKTYLKTKENERKLNLNPDEEEKERKYITDNFNLVKTCTTHHRTIIKVVHSIFDQMIYSIGFDNHLIGYNVKYDKGKVVLF